MNAWPKLATLAFGEVVCPKCGVKSAEINVTYIPTSNNFRGNCTSCDSYVKFLSAGMFSIGEREPQASWVVLGQKADDPSADEVLAVCADEAQALKAQETLRFAGFINTKVSEVPA